MNKTQLIEQLKKPVDQIDALLKAAGISTNLENYSDEHLKTLQELDEMVVSGKAKTLKDAAKLHRQQQQTSTASEQTGQINKYEQLLLAQAEQAAELTLASFPEIAIEEYNRLKALFVQRYRQRIAERLQDPEYRQRFQAAIEGHELGKFTLNNMTSNTALPSSSSSSS